MIPVAIKAFSTHPIYGCRIDSGKKVLTDTERIIYIASYYAYIFVIVLDDKRLYLHRVDKRPSAIVLFRACHF
jgi:hypothetical protein